MSGATKAIGNLFSPPKMKAPAISAMPTPDTFQQKLAARTDARIDRRKRKGRDATIKTAGGMYSGSNLGGTSG